MKKETIKYAFIAAVGVSLIYFSPNIYQNLKSRYTDADRQVFKQSVTYNEGVLDDLAKYKYEYTQADEVEKKAIASLVRSRFANFDKNKIENRELVDFLEVCGL